jgi:hypothetical protein
MKFRTAALALALGLAFTAGANAVTIGFNPRTGDVWVDTQLREVNQYGYDDRSYFVDDLVNNFGAPRYLINDLLVTRRWAPGDVYYACALAYQLHRPCGDVVHEYEQDHGQGWGVVAQRMGIKPGSAEFFALKGQVGKSHGRFKEHDHGPKADWGDHGPGNSGEHGQGKSHGHKDWHGNSGDHGPGNSGGHGHGNSGEHGNGGGKGKSKKGGGR